MAVPPPVFPPDTIIRPNTVCNVSGKRTILPVVPDRFSGVTRHYAPDLGEHEYGGRPAHWRDRVRRIARVLSPGIIN